MQKNNSDLFKQMKLKLEATLQNYKKPIIAVSGGVDSVTLSSFAHRVLGRENVKMVHALSPAVPKAATKRLRQLASHEKWDFECINAGEFSDNRYRSNPVNRCFFCKTNLYKVITEVFKGTVLSGTNIDDLGDFRPGLKAASNYRVQHPYIEAGFKKSDLRFLAEDLGLTAISRLPSSPCLSSRIETGIPIRKSELRSVDYLEAWVQKNFSPRIVRCRARSEGVVIELDELTANSLLLEDREKLVFEVQRQFPQYSKKSVRVAPYRQGSAFVGERGAEANA